MSSRPPASSAAGSPSGRRGTTAPDTAPAGVLGAPPTPAALWRDSFGRLAIRSLQILLVAGFVAFAGWLAVTLKLVTLPLLLALIIASAMYPIIRWLHRMRFSRVWAAIAALLGIVLVIAGVVFMIVMTVINEWSDLAANTQQGISQMITVVQGWGVPLDDTHINEYLQKASELLKSGNAGSSAVQGFSAVTEFGAGALLMIVMLFFFFLDGPRMWDFLVGFVPGRYRERTNAAGQASVRVLGKYIRGTVIIAAFAAIMDLIAMLVMKIPLAFPLAALIFLGAFIPIVGALTTGLAAALIALVTAGPLPAVVLVCVVILVNQVEHHILQPKVMGTALSLHGIIIISALAIGAHEGGVAGALLAVPLTAVAWASFKVFRTMRRDDVNDPPLEDGERRAARAEADEVVARADAED